MAEPDRPPPTQAESVDHDRRRLSAWLWRLPVLIAVGGGAWGVREAYRVYFGKREPSRSPAFEDAAPVQVAALAAFAADWDAVPFVLAGVPCLAMRLPNAVAGSLDLPHAGPRLAAGPRPAAGQPPAPALHLAAFSRVCTHQQCIVDLSTDPELVAFAYNHRSELPSLTCACHYSVFDPSQAGRAVSGPALQPLPRARLRLQGEGAEATVWADGMEPAPT